MVGILEDLTDDPDSDVDVSSLLELISAYAPGAESIPEEEVDAWLCQVADTLRENKKRGEGDGINGLLPVVSRLKFIRIEPVNRALNGTRWITKVEKRWVIFGWVTK